jgi:acyl-CoA thioesterase FadM
MNLWLRLIYVLVASFFKDRLPAGKSENSLALRVLPNDLDLNLHMNNGRYLTLCDLNRVDLFIRTGLLKSMFRRKWAPIIAEHTMTYRKPLRCFARFDVSMTLDRWDEKYFYMTHLFRRGDVIVAEGTSRGAVLSRTGVIPPLEVLAAVESDRRGS